MIRCCISISCYPSQPQFSHKYGLAITKPGEAAQVRNIGTDDDLTRLLKRVGHTDEQVADLVSSLKRDPKILYFQDIGEDVLRENGF